MIVTLITSSMPSACHHHYHQIETVEQTKCTHACCVNNVHGKQSVENHNAEQNFVHGNL